MSGKTITIIGATGLTGSYLYDLAKQDLSVETIRLLVRRPFQSIDKKTEIRLVDFSDYESMQLAIDGSNAVFCAVGTTRKKVKGDKQAYRKIDFDIPVKAARACRATGCPVFVLVSSVGADAHSSNFYLRLKGETEDAVIATGPGTIHILRPSMLLGKRNENRLAEAIGQQIMNHLAFLIPAKYRAIEAGDAAKAMLRLGLSEQTGIHFYEYPQLMNKE